MRDQRLKPEEGVTYDIFKEKEAEGEKEGAEGGEEAEGGEKVEEVPEEEEEPHLLIKDVVREPRMKFFEVPRLGSYLAVPLNYEKCELEPSFDKGLQNHLTCEERREAQAQEKEAFEEEQKGKREEHEAAGTEEPFVEEKREWEEIVEDDF